MKKIGILFIVSAIFIVSCNTDNKKVELISYEDSLSYAIGSDIAQNFKRNNLDSLNIDVLASGIKDYFAEDSSIMTGETVNDILVEFSQKMRVEAELKRVEENKIKFKNDLETGQKFLEENAKIEGVVTTESGLQYKIIKEGKGNKPAFSDKVRVHYQGTLIDGTQFDSSYDRGEAAEFGVNQVIPGWAEALQLMTEGSQWELYIPYQLAYGDRGSGNINPFSTLVFKVELLKIIK